MDAQTDRLHLDLDSPFGDPLRQALFSFVKRPLSKVLRLDTLNSMYSELREMKSDVPFVDRAFKLLGVKFDLGGQSVSRIPKTGPLVAVCNHPFGILEGLLLTIILKSVRSDIKIMSNYMLGKIPELDELLIEVDPFGKPESAKKNIAGLKASMKWLKDGGMLVVFPAGEVSSLNVKKTMVADSLWSPMIGKIIRRTGASALPVFFEGRNSGLFQALGLIHPRLRTFLLPNENLKHAEGGSVRVAFGSTIETGKLAGFASDQEMMDYLRFRTYLLRKNDSKKREPMVFGRKKSLPPIASSRGKHILASEVGALADENILIKTAEFTVFQAGAFQIPRIMREIGIRREETFRAVGEGTGKPMDIDRFDDTYRHLVLWNHVEREVVGAYRFGLTDELLKEHGPEGLYTSTLFDYRPGMLGGIGPALELGRSFIIPKYQKGYQPLLLLWRGLAAFVVANPKYTKLFGCVSISGEYSGLSRELIVGFMERHSFLPELADMTLPRRPLTLKKLKRVDFSLPEALYDDPDDVSELVQDIEGGKSIPVLLKQYLKLGGKIIGFNVDPDFGNCLDGLILVDLVQSDPRMLVRFMGKDGMDEFMAANTNVSTSANGNGERRKTLHFAA